MYHNHLRSYYFTNQILLQHFSIFFFTSVFNTGYLCSAVLTLVRAKLTRVSSPPNPTAGGSQLIFSVHFSYFLFIFYLPHCTLPDFLSVSSLASLPFLPYCHRTRTTYHNIGSIKLPNALKINNCIA